MEKLDSVDLWLLRNSVECKMINLMDIIKETKSENVMKLYGDYAALLSKISIIEIGCVKENFSK